MIVRGSMQSIDSFINSLGFPTAFEMVFGLIISIILFLIDRSEKKRQEETLRRQDESLDIILEQVSKVNVFQTKTLSLAIESLGKDFENFRKDIDDIKSSMIPKISVETDIQNNLNQDSVIKAERESTKTPPVSLSANFGNVLSNQINSFINQMKSNLSNLTDPNKGDKKNIYKVKKGIEFDIKDLFNIQNMLNDLQEEFDSENIDSRNEELISEDDEEDDEISSTRELEKIDLPKVKSDSKQKSFDISDLNSQLKSLESIPELVKFTESIIKKFENPEVMHGLSTGQNNLKQEKKKVKPSKVISKSDINNKEKSSE